MPTEDEVRLPRSVGSMLDESHSSHNSSGRNEERHGAKAGNRQPGSDTEAMGVGCGVFDAAEEKVTLGVRTVPKAVALEVSTETASCTH